MASFKKDYQKFEEQNDVTIVGIGNDNSLPAIVFETVTNILGNLKFTMFPIILETINYILIGNFGRYEDIIVYSISILFINLLGLTFGIGILDSFEEIDIKNNLDIIKENRNTSLICYYDCTKFFLYLTLTFLTIFSYFSKNILFLFNFNEQVIAKSAMLIQFSIISNLFILLHFFNLKLLRISNQIKQCDRVNISIVVIHSFFSFMLIFFLEDKILALALSILISSIIMYILSSFFVDEYAVVKPTIFTFNCSSISNLGLSYFKMATFYGVKNLINYLFFAVFLLLSIHLTEYEFAINSLVSNFMRVFYSLALAIGLSYKYYFDFKNSVNFIQQYSNIFYIVVGSLILLVGIIFMFLHTEIAGMYTYYDIISEGVDSVVLLYPFFFLLESLICISEQVTNLRKKKHKKYNHYGLILNIIAIIIFSPIASIFAFYWDFSYGGIWICYFEFLVFKFIVYLIINIFRF